MAKKLWGANKICLEGRSCSCGSIMLPAIKADLSGKEMVCCKCKKTEPI